MKHFSFLLSVVLLFLSCATSNTRVQYSLLNEVIDTAVKEIETKISSGKTVALVNFSSTSDAYSEYVVDELTTKLVSCGKYKISTRKELDIIRAEMLFQLSGDVSDESAQRVGKQIGANYIITGSILEMKDFYKFRLNVINVETAVIEASVSLNLNINDSQTKRFFNNQDADEKIYTSLSLKNPVISGTTTVNNAVKKPLWIDNPYFLHDKDKYYTAVGYGKNTEEAVSNATYNLTGIFGQAIVSYESEGVSVISVKNTMDYIIGAAISEIWDDKNGNCYALAVINKKIAYEKYSLLLKENLKMIENLVKIPDAEKYTFNSIFRLLKAAEIADATINYASVVSYTSGSTEVFRGLKRGDDYRLEANKIIKSIPIRVSVQNDRNSTIRDAFYLVIVNRGFRIGSLSSRFNFDVNVSRTYSSQYTDKSLLLNVDAKLIDTSNNTVIFQYNVKDHFAGELSNAETEYVAIETMDKIIKDDFQIEFEKFINSSIPNY